MAFPITLPESATNQSACSSSVPWRPDPRTRFLRVDSSIGFSGYEWPAGSFSPQPDGSRTGSLPTQVTARRLDRRRGASSGGGQCSDQFRGDPRLRRSHPRLLLREIAMARSAFVNSPAISLPSQRDRRSPEPARTTRCTRGQRRIHPEAETSASQAPDNPVRGSRKVESISLPAGKYVFTATIQRCKRRSADRSSVSCQTSGLQQAAVHMGLVRAPRSRDDLGR